MNDSQFDDFFQDKLRGLAAPVPGNLWEKVSEGQFDQFVGSKLKDSEAPVPEGLWNRIGDAQFDDFVGDALFDQQAPVPAGLWDKITDGQFDNFIGDALSEREAPLPAGLWDKISDGQFDAFMAGRLIDHEAPVPAGLWEKVKPEEEEDRPAILWFRYPGVAAMLIGILVAAGAIGGYFLFSKKDQTPTTAGAPAVNQNAGRPSGNASDHSSPAAGDSPQGAANPPATMQDNTPQQPAQGLNGHSATTDPAAANSSAANLPAIAPSINHSSVTPPTSDRVLHRKGDISQDNGQERTLSGRKGKIGFSLLPPSDNGATDVAHNAYDPFKNSTAASTEETPVTEIEPYQPRSLLAGTTIPFSLDYYSISKQLSTQNHTNQFKSVIICPTDRRGNTDWFLEAYVSPDIALRSVNNISASQLYLLKKDSAESMRVGYSAGIRLVKPINDNILLKAGVQYTQANQNYTYRTENEVKTTTVVTQRTIIRGPGDTVLVSDTSVLQTAGYRTNTVKNRFRTIDIPVTIGYQFGDEDLKFGINAGVVFNLTSWYQGVILDSSLATVTASKSGNGVYKSHLGLGLIGSISVVKKLSDDLSIFAEPYFRYNISNMTTSQSTFSQRFSLGGLSLGLRLNLNRR